MSQGASPLALASWAVGALVGVGLQAFGWPELFRTLLAYAFAARIPVALIMLLAIFGGWQTHYDVAPPDFPAHGPLLTWFYIGAVPQFTFWIFFTVVIGCLFRRIDGARGESRGLAGPRRRGRDIDPNRLSTAFREAGIFFRTMERHNFDHPRRAPRKKARVRVLYFSKGSPRAVDAECQNISTDGLFIQTRRRGPEKGTAVSLILQFDELGEIMAEGVVRWQGTVRPLDDRGTEETGMGIQFTDLAADARAGLAAALVKLPDV